MAAGHNLKKGEYRQCKLTEDEMWSAFAYTFSPKSIHVASYKYGFLKAILDNLYNTDEKLLLTFDQLFGKFAEIYWNLVLKYHIKQKSSDANGRVTTLERVLWETRDRFQIEEGIPFESLSDDAAAFVCNKVKQGCKDNVVGALYGDLQGLLYSFDIKAGWIQFNPVMYEFICKHKVAIEKINYYEWAKYLEKINKDDVMDHLLTKIDESAKRNNLSYYRDILFEEFENKCFYCGKKVTEKSVHVDHFIPWSFIKDDNLWNFVLACPKCNISKKDKLASEDTLIALISRNEKIVIEKTRINVMRYYQADRLKRIYNWARDNGYSDIWIPPTRKEVVNG